MIETPTKEKSSKKSGDTISHELIGSIKSRLLEGKPVRRTLPLGGRLHIDRALPFLVVYRRPVDRPDNATDRFVKGEASYLIASASKKLEPSLRKLVRTIIELLATKYGAVLIAEIWSDPNYGRANEFDVAKARPAFRIITSVRPPARTVEVFESDFRRIRMNRQAAKVEVIASDIRTPVNLHPFISNTDARKINCYTVGLEIAPIYRHPQTGDIYPIALRHLHFGLSNALKKAIYIFSKRQTTLRAAHYQALGRRAFVKAVWMVDSQLAEIDNSFDFLLQVTPVNINDNWHKFHQRHFENVPMFYYRMRPADPSLLKRSLFKIPIEDVEDPVLASLFREKRTELDRKLSMLEDRNTSNFLMGSLQLYGRIDNELNAQAKELLRVIPPHTRSRSDDPELDCQAMLMLANNELDYYRKIYPDLSTTAEIRDDVPGLMVSSGKLLVSTNTKIRLSRANALLQHEIGTHVVTYFNGRAQPLKLLCGGLAGYDEMQEGLAVLAEYFADGLSEARLRMLAGRVVAADSMVKGSSFIETFRELSKNYDFNQRTAYTITARTYRGGGLTKDVIYLRGLQKMLIYLKEGGDIEPLLVGKIALDHVPVIKELQWRKVLHPAPIRPRYLDFESTSSKLDQLRNGLNVQDLVSDKVKNKKKTI